MIQSKHSVVTDFRKAVAPGGCLIPLWMGDVYGRSTNNPPDPRQQINSKDALWLLRNVAGFLLPNGGVGCSPQDIDCDFDIDAVDGLWILRWIAELPYSQVEPCPDIGEDI